MHFHLVWLLFSLASAAPWQQQSHNDSHARAIYTLYNDPSGNNILSLALSPVDGTVSSPVLTSTGGKGLLGLNVGPPFGPPGSTAGPDGLFGSGAVAVSHNYLFTVNPGSHTLSMFKIPPRDVARPQMIGKPVDTMGEFPTSVAYSHRLHLACVVNGGAKNGVACFSVSGDSGLSPLGNLRPLENLQTKTPPTGPPDTASEIAFNPSSTALFVVTKAQPGPPAVPGSIYAFGIDSNGHVSESPVVSRPSNLILDFSIDFLGSDGSALITDPVFGASLVSITPELEVSESQHVVIPYQAAACWAAYAPKFDAVYVTDAGNPNITVLDPHDGNIKGAIQFETAAMGGYDVAVDRQWLYFLAKDSSIIVVNLEGSGGKEVQHFSLDSQGQPNHWQGMAVYPSA